MPNKDKIIHEKKLEQVKRLAETKTQRTKDKYLNKIFISREGIKFEIVEYFDYQNVTIKFENGLIKQRQK